MKNVQYKKVNPADFQDAEYVNFVDLSSEEINKSDYNFKNSGVVIPCPKCGINIKTDNIINSFFYCQCCGSRLFFENDRLVLLGEDAPRYDDDTYNQSKKRLKLEKDIIRLKEQYKYEQLKGKYELEKIRNARRVESESSWKETKLSIKWTFYIVLLIVIVIFLIYSSISSKIDNKKAAKQKAEIEAQMISQGKISAGYSSDYTGEYYYAVVSNLKEQGFTNIETKKLNDGDIFDEIFGNKKENTVESISIAGKSYFRPDDYFNPNDKILICYH